MNAKYRKNLLHIFAIVMAVIWSVLVGGIGYFNSYNYYKTAELIALNEAQVSVKKDLAYRTWVTSHGGVYVPVTEKTPPNPYLSHIKDRDFTVNDKNFTLMNPAYTLSQMMRNYSELYGVKAKITSKNLLNPKNAPDSWEEKALDKVEMTREPFYELDNIGSITYLRYMNPLVTKPDCLKCHAHQGYQVGDLRGGVAVSIPLEKHYALAYKQTLTLLSSLIVIWIIGLVIIYFAYKKIKANIDAKTAMYEQNIYSLVDIIEQRDSYTAGHTRRVAKYSKLIAKEMGFNSDKIELLYKSAMLHDIGKISTPDSILLKPGRLSSLEFDLIKEHATSTYEILRSVDIFNELAEIARHHHERYDGKGYPQGLSGAKIPILAYILSLADAFDAMTTDRIYKGRKVLEDALKDIEKNSGTQFHPEVAQNALVALKDIELDYSIHQKPKSVLEEQRFAYFYIDQLTHVRNRDYLELVLAHRDSEELMYKCVYGVYLHNFTNFNKENGWNVGNELLKSFAQELTKEFPEALIFRLFGDDFIILNKEHAEFPNIDNFNSIKDTSVEISYRHIDLHNKIVTINELEMML